MAHQISHKASLTNLQQPNSTDGRHRDEPRGNEPQEAKRMSVNDRKIQQQPRRVALHPQQVRLRPHGKWADKIIRLAQGQLSDAERQEVENHLRGCLACADAYRVYRGVSCVVRDVPPPQVPVGLPPRLQALKQRLTTPTKKNAAPRERPARPQQTLRAVGDEPSQQQESVQTEEALATRPSADMSAEKDTHPAVEEARRILRSAKGPSHSKKGFDS